MARPKKIKPKRAASPYAVFVKTHYPAAKKKFTRPQDRIRHIAQLWRESKKVVGKKDTEETNIDKSSDE